MAAQRLRDPQCYFYQITTNSLKLIDLNLNERAEKTAIFIKENGRLLYDASSKPFWTRGLLTKEVVALAWFLTGLEISSPEFADFVSDQGARIFWKSVVGTAGLIG